MITSQITKLQTISIPLTQADHKIALKIAQPQLTKEKQKQVYANVLSVLVVKHYLDILGIESDFKKSEVYQPFQHLTQDIADLKITDSHLGKQGHLECRHLMQDEANIYIPFEALEDRIAYVFVQFDTSYREGLILGFLPIVNQERIAINQLNPLREMIEFFYEPKINWLNLRDWLNDRFNESWLSLEEAIKFSNFNPQVAFRFAPDYHFRIGINQLLKNLGVKINLNNPISELTHIIQTTENEETRWQAVDILRQIEPNYPATGVRRINELHKYLNIPVALMVAIVEKSNQQVAVLLRVYPVGVENTLPPQLKLSLFEGTDNLLREVVANAEPLDICIQLKFVADFGEKFNIRVTLGEEIFTEYFVV